MIFLELFSNYDSLIIPKQDLQNYVITLYLFPRKYFLEHSVYLIYFQIIQLIPLEWTYVQETDCLRCCSSMFVLCSLNVLFMSCCHPPKSVTDEQRSLSSPESVEHPPNLELNGSEMECLIHIFGSCVCSYCPVNVPSLFVILSLDVRCVR